MVRLVLVLGLAGWLALVAPAAANWSPPETVFGATSNSVDTEAFAVDMDSSGGVIVGACPPEPSGVSGIPTARHRPPGGSFGAAAEVAPNCGTAKLVLDDRAGHEGRAIGVLTVMGDVFLAVRDAGTGAWSRKLLSASNSTALGCQAACIDPDVAVDPSSGAATAAWSRNTGSGWTIQTVEIAADGTPGAVTEPITGMSTSVDVRVARNAAGAAALVWRTTSFDNIWVSTRSGPMASWTAAAFLSGNGARSPHVVIDASGGVTALWHATDGETCGTPPCAAVREGSASSGAFGAAQALAPSSSVGGPWRQTTADAALVIDGAGRRSAIYSTAGAVQVRSRAAADAGWGTAATVASEAAAKAVLAVDAAGDLFAAWTRVDDNAVRAAAGSGGVWETAASLGGTDPEYGSDRFGTGIAAGAAGRAIVIWGDGASGVPLKASLYTRAAAVPANASPPTVPAKQIQNLQATAQPGGWSHSPTSYAYAWLSCTGAELADCTAIDGATTASYTPAKADLGKRLRVRVVATNADGSSEPAVSAASDPVSLVTIAGSAAPAAAGTIAAASGDPDAVCSGAGCSAPHGATVSFTATPAQGYTFSGWSGACSGPDPAACSVQAGEQDATVTATFTAPAPSNVTPPSIPADAIVGKPFAVDRGEWSGDATGYQWRLHLCTPDGCAALTDWAELTDTTTYTPASSQHGMMLRVEVRAGNASATSAGVLSPKSGAVRPLNVTVARSGAPGGIKPTIIGTTPYSCVADGAGWDCRIEYGMTLKLTATDYEGVDQYAPGVGFESWDVCPGSSSLDCFVEVKEDLTATAHFVPAPSNLTPPALPADPIVNKEFAIDRGQWSADAESFEYALLRCEPVCTDTVVWKPWTADAKYTPAFNDSGRKLVLGVRARRGRALSAPVMVFGQAEIRFLLVTATSPGNGTVKAVHDLNPLIFDCAAFSFEFGASCRVAYGASVKFAAEPFAGHGLDRWEGCGPAGDCELASVTSDVKVTAHFVPGPANQRPPAAPASPILDKPLAVDAGEWPAGAAVEVAIDRCGPCIEGRFDPFTAGATYTPTYDDLGRFLRVRARAKDARATSLPVASEVSQPVRALQVKVLRSGAGTVSAKPSTGAVRCQQVFDAGNWSCDVGYGGEISLQSTPAPGYELKEWDVCPGRGDCLFSGIRTDTQATASFRLVSVAPLLDDIRELIAARCTIALLAKRCTPALEVPEAGTMLVTLLAQPGGAKASAAAARRRGVTIASARAVAKGAGPLKVRLRASRRGLAAARRARGRVVLKVQFRPASGGRRQAQAKVRLKPR